MQAAECTRVCHKGVALRRFDVVPLPQQWRPGRDLYSVRQNAHEGPQNGGDEGQDHSLRRGKEFWRCDTVSYL